MHAHVKMANNGGSNCIAQMTPAPARDELLLCKGRLRVQELMMNATNSIHMSTCTMKAEHMELY